MTKNKVLGLFIFLNFVPKILFSGKFGPKLESGLFNMKVNTKGCSRVLTMYLATDFLSFIPEIPFLGKFGPETSKCFFRMKMHTKRYSEELISN